MALFLPSALPLPGPFSADGPAAASELPLCWPEDRLRGTSQEHHIRKDIAAAFRAPPTGRARRPAATGRFFGGAIRRVDLPPDVRKVALTFDLCEQPHEISGFQGDIVDYLRDNRIPATFFAGGKWFLTHPQRAEQILADPLFEVANHAWEHRNFRLLDTTRANVEIGAAQRAYEIIRAGLEARGCRAPWSRQPAHRAAPQSMHLFRFPFGACKPDSLKAVNDAGLMAIQWDVSSGDPWRGMTTEDMVRQVVGRTRPGSIIIFHANGRGWKTGAALPQIIRALRNRGFGFVTVSELLAIPGAKPVVSKTCYDARPGDSDRYDALAVKLEARYRAFYERFAPADRKPAARERAAPH